VCNDIPVCFIPDSYLPPHGDVHCFSSIDFICLGTPVTAVANADHRLARCTEPPKTSAVTPPDRPNSAYQSFSVNEIRCINPWFTYLLTYLLTYLFWVIASSVGTKSTLRGRKGQNSKPEWLSQGFRVLREGAYHPSPPARGFAGELWASPAGFVAKPRPTRIFLAFWVLHVSYPAVLLCKAVCVGPLYRCTINGFRCLA